MKTKATFATREEAGQKLGLALRQYKRAHPLILAISEAGVQVGLGLADVLDAPLEILVTCPFCNSDHSVAGAVCEGHTIACSVPDKVVEEDGELHSSEVAAGLKVSQKAARYRSYKPLRSLENQTIIVVDDALPDQYVAAAALSFIAKQSPKHIVLAVPMTDRDTVTALPLLADEVVCLHMGEGEVLNIYEKPEPITDEAVTQALQGAFEHYQRRHKDRYKPKTKQDPSATTAASYFS